MDSTATDPAPDQTPRSPRRRVVLIGTVETLSGCTTVSLRNLSCTGAMVEADRAPEAGKEVILKAPGLDCFATVVWSDGRRCGLRFDEPLTQAQVLELHRVTPEVVRSAEARAAAEWFQSQGRYARL